MVQMSKETDLIKQKLDLVEFLRSYLTLIPAGKSLKAVCPFHQEKTPSFIVSPERQMWHCFGCGIGGDIIGFVMRYESLEFPEALRFLADRAGITLQTLSPTEQREFGILYDIHEAAMDFFRTELKKQPKANVYLRERGLHEDTIEEFELGFAPGGETLTLNLIKRGYDVSDIVRAGLAHKGSSGLYRDRFQARIMFPIFNYVGRAVAFTGRLLEGVAPTSTDMPKYLNSPETPIFNKSKILYGFHKSKQSIAQSRSALIVEGQMDFLVSWQVGVKNVVALSGTGLSQHHLERLRRIADTVIVSFDNDAAGLRAFERSLEMFSQFDYHVRAMNLGKFKDPADAGRESPDFLKRAVEEAPPGFNYLLLHYFDSDSSESGGVVEQKRTVRHLLGLIKNMKSAVEQGAWIKELAKYSNVSEVALMSEFEALPVQKEKGESGTTGGDAERSVFVRSDVIADRLLIIAFTDQSFLFRAKQARDFFPLAYQKVFDKPEEAAGQFEMKAGLLDTKDKAAIGHEFDELLYQLQIEFLKQKQQGLRETMRKAEAGGNEAALEAALGQFHDLMKKIEEFKSRK
ncbi:DNA primase [Candidatus Jorgensenbacteria bacterium]|nr:DNA primase [Candidatus Jorgensenbacteria bacterium]